MRNYELAYIVDPDLDEASQKELEEKITGWIEAAGGVPGEIDRWGKRRLAYPILKKNDGFYTFIQVQLPPQGGGLLERDLGLNEQILRFMLTSKEED